MRKQSINVYQGLSSPIRPRHPNGTPLVGSHAEYDVNGQVTRMEGQRRHKEFARHLRDSPPGTVVVIHSIPYVDAETKRRARKTAGTYLGRKLGHTDPSQNGWPPAFREFIKQGILAGEVVDSGYAWDVCVWLTPPQQEETGDLPKVTFIDGKAYEVV